MFKEIAKISSSDLSVASKELWSIMKSQIEYLDTKGREVIELAFIQMVEAHGEQRRKSGEFYITHPVAAATVLANMKLDSDTIAACLMHDVPEDTHVTLKQLEKDFNPNIIFLISGITKLSKIKYQGEERYAENLRKMFVAMSQDMRVIFIKLADRLHNLKTLKILPPEKAYRIALESLEIYAPIADRLGMSVLKSELEDAAFPYVYPQEYKQFLSLSSIEIEKRKKQVERILKKLKKILIQEDLKGYKVYGRAKKYYSLYKKVSSKHPSLTEINDLVAVRIITPQINDCYHVLSLIHSHFVPVDHKIKDYISYPKSNGYQSLHTTVKDDQTGLVFEVQIRTADMHEYAEYGMAAHWSYKSKKNAVSDQFINSESLKWMKELIDLGKQDLTPEDYLKHVRLDLFQDRIFVMTPKHDVINLPLGATPLDFAYKIHEHIGSQACMAKVNGHPVKLSDELKNGDIVEIVTDSKQKPKRDWLSWVKTAQASKHIRYTLRKQQKSENQ